MNHLIWRDARSSLKDGIETVLIPISHPNDLARLARETERGTYAVCEWLLTELGRWAELDRVCGLSVSVSNGVVVNLEMRQPGKQMEEWLDGKGGYDLPHDLPLCERALSREKFTDKHRPWWEAA